MTFSSWRRRTVAALATLGAFGPAFAIGPAPADAPSTFLVAQNESASRAGAARPLEHVKLAYGVRVIGPDGAAYTSVPKQEKFWENEGLAVDIQSLDTGPAFQLLAQGKLDFLIAGSGSGLALVENGAPIKAIAAGYKFNIFYPAVLPDSDIKSLRQIKGKTVGLFTPAGSAVVMLDAVLHEYGLTKKDLKGVVTVGTGASAINALKTKQIDIYFGYQGAYNTIEATTDVRFRRFNDDPLFVRTAFASPGVWTRTALIKDRKETVIGFLRGVNAGIAFSRKDPVAAIKDHFALYPQTKPPGSEEDAIRDGVKSLVNNLTTYSDDPYGLVPIANVEATAKMMQSAGVIKSVSPGSRYYTDEFVKAGSQYDAKAVEKALAK
jgi:NitT/TauT family transport system substrate-binding protein